MMQGVFSDMKDFVYFYVIVMIVFSAIFYILALGLPGEYTPIGSLGYLLMSIRTSLGDFAVDSFSELDDVLIYLAWIIWLAAVLITNLIMMNFIIAVISDSYGKIMEKMEASQFMQKASMIQEREVHFSSEDKQNPLYFPKYILVRKVAVAESGEGSEI